MSLRRSILKGAALLSAGQAVGQGLSFVRNIIVARFVCPADFGIAATFAITVSLLEMVSDLAADKLLIQAKDGDEESLQATAQAWQVLRGVCAAALLLLLAWPFAALFHVPQAQWAFYWLAAVPLLRGFVHLDIRRLQRHMQYWPAVLAESGAQLLATAAAVALAWWLRSYAAMLWIVILQSAALTLGSHLVARRPYRWGWHRVQGARLESVGWPLLLNGLLMFATLQGDRLLIGSCYTMHELGVYSVAATLVLAPTSIAVSIGSPLLLPLLAQVQDLPARLMQRYTLAMQLFAALAGLFAAVFFFVGSALVRVVFGAQYASGVGLVLMLLAAAQAARLLRIPPTIAAMARGDTQNALLANVARAVPFLLAIGAALRGWALEWVAATAVLGEALAFAYAVGRLHRRQQMPWAVSLLPAAVTALGVSVAASLAPLVAEAPVVQVAFLIVAAGLGLGTLLLFSEARAELQRLAVALARRVQAGL